MLETGFADQDDELSIPEDDIKSYFEKKDEIAVQRQLLRETLKQKGGCQSSILYVNLPVTQPPVDRLIPDFAWWEQMWFTFQRQNFLS